MAEWFKQQAVNLSYIGSNPIPCATNKVTSANFG